MSIINILLLLIISSLYVNSLQVPNEIKNTDRTASFPGPFTIETPLTQEYLIKLLDIKEDEAKELKSEIDLSFWQQIVNDYRLLATHYVRELGTTDCYEIKKNLESMVSIFPTSSIFQDTFYPLCLVSVTEMEIDKHMEERAKHPFVDSTSYKNVKIRVTKPQANNAYDLLEDAYKDISWLLTEGGLDSCYQVKSKLKRSSPRFATDKYGIESDVFDLVCASIEKRLETEKLNECSKVDNPFDLLEKGYRDLSLMYLKDKGLNSCDEVKREIQKLTPKFAKDEQSMEAVIFDLVCNIVYCELQLEK